MTSCTSDKNDTDLAQLRASLLGEGHRQTSRVRAIFEATQDRGNPDLRDRAGTRAS